MMLQKLRQLQNKNVIVAGAGRSGIAAARFLNQLSAHVTFVDDADINAITRRTCALGFPECASMPILAMSSEVFESADVIVLSPGISRHHPMLAKAFAKQIPIINEIDLAVAHLDNCRFVGITGTNGKSTTTTILGSIAKAFDPDAFVGGNLGTPLCEALANGQSPKLAILELSSYQLEILSLLRLDAAIVTNLAPDHLDRYSSVFDYYQAKARIFDLLTPHGVAILNQGDSASKEFIALNTTRFDFNTARGARGVHIDGHRLEIYDGAVQAIISLHPDIYLGAHNCQNAAAALSAAFMLGIPMEQIHNGLNAYKGIAHRLETLGYVKGVRWINDSKATNVDSALIAVKSFDQGIHLIVGGLGKGSSYEALRHVSQGRVKTIYVVGQDAPHLLHTFQNFPHVIDAKTIDNAVFHAQSTAQSGDIILLAPACSSLDQYESFIHRGDHFRALYHNAKMLEGEA